MSASQPASPPPPAVAPPDPIAVALRGDGWRVRTGPFAYRLRSNVPAVLDGLRRLYGNYPAAGADDFIDFDVEVRRSGGWRRFLRAQARFRFEGSQSFEPLPVAHGFAMLEWAMNWCISSHVNHHLLIHSAVVERGGRAVILPAPPGSGKSTLCAALALRGWRLLSDELTRLDPDTLLAHALARPINLKNASIDVIRRFQPDLTWAPDVYDTSRGRVTHLKPPVDSVRRMLEPATPRWIVFPRYVPDAEPLLTPRSKVATFNHFAQNAFNYSILGELGFRTVARLVDQCDCYDFSYSRLEDALEVFDWLLNPDD